MIVIHNRRESACQDPFVMDYRRARTALILHLAADAGILCHHHVRDTKSRYLDNTGYLETITIESCPETPEDFRALFFFLEGLKENNLLVYMEDIEDHDLTPEERSCLAEYDLFSPAGIDTAGIEGGER